VLEVMIPPGGGPPMLHRHDPFELYRVRSGDLAVYLEDGDGAVRRRVAGAGDVVPIDAGREHTVRNESTREARATVVFSPGEPMELFARAVGELGRNTDDAEIFALARAHGIEITRPLDDALVETRRSATASRPASGTGYLSIARFSGDRDRLLATYRTYSDVMSEVGRDHGLILHAATQTNDGFLIVNLWPSKEGSEAAARDPRRLAVIELAGLDPKKITREYYEEADFLVPARVTPQAP
jgi:hypothetical protein